MMRKLLFALSALYIIAGCEDVIEVEVPNDKPRLSVDAIFRIDTSKPEQTVQVLVGLTSGFFSEAQSTELEDIRVINPDYVPTSALDENELALTQTGPGVYEAIKSTAFFTNGTLELHIQHLGQNYRAFTTYVPTSDIDKLIQGDETLFGGEETEIVVSFTDQANREDFYLFDLDFNEYLVTEDEFYPGQQFEFSYFYDDAVTPGEQLNISLLGVDEQFYNYMNQVIVQANSGEMGPFTTPATTVRGNIINVTDLDGSNSFDDIGNRDNFALGYFAICQTFTKSITVE